MNGCIYRTEENRCEFWSDNGAGIVSYCDYEGCVDKHPSNADRIRAMTDEELADWYFNEFSRKVPYCRKEECYEDTPCEDCLLDWLKQEAE